MNKAIEMPGDGQTMVELGLILALVSVVAILMLTFLGGQVKDKFEDVGKTLQDTKKS